MLKPFFNLRLCYYFKLDQTKIITEFFDQLIKKFEFEIHQKKTSYKNHIS